MPLLWVIPVSCSGMHNAEVVDELHVSLLHRKCECMFLCEEVYPV